MTWETFAVSAWPCSKGTKTQTAVDISGCPYCKRRALSVLPLEVWLVQTTSSPGACKPVTESSSLQVKVPKPHYTYFSFSSNLNGDRVVVHLICKARCFKIKFKRCAGPESSTKQSRCQNSDGSLLNTAGFRFQRAGLSLGSQGWEWQGGCEYIRIVTKIAIFGHNSALGNSEIKGFLE